MPEKRRADTLDWLLSAEQAWGGEVAPPEPDGGLLNLILAVREVMKRHPETQDTFYLMLDVKGWKERETREKGHNDRGSF